MTPPAGPDARPRRAGRGRTPQRVAAPLRRIATPRRVSRTGCPVVPSRTRGPSRYRLRSSPPAYPVRVPSAPMTRWQGTTIAIGFAPLARPDGAGGARLHPQPTGDLAVRRCLPERDRAAAPRRAAGSRCRRRQRKVEVLEVTCEVRLQLAPRLDENGVGLPVVARLRRHLVVEVQQGQCCPVAAQLQAVRPVTSSPWRRSSQFSSFIGGR